MDSIKTVGPTDDFSDLWSIMRTDLREELHKKVHESLEKGSDVLCGGKTPSQNGYYCPETIIDGIKLNIPSFSEELYGSLASLIKAKDNADVMRIANDSKFGLGGSIFSKERDKAIILAKNHFETGMVHINPYGLAYSNMPFSSVKDSGYRREDSDFGVKEFVNLKAIVIIKNVRILLNN